MDIIISFRARTYTGSTSIMMEVKNSRPIKIMGESDLVKIFARVLRGVKIEDSTKLFEIIRSLEQIAEKIAEAQHLNVELEAYHNDALLY